MLILILIDVQYSQNAVYSFEKDSNNQNHSSGSYHSVKKLPPAVFTTSLHEKEQCLIIETLAVNIRKFIVNKIDLALRQLNCSIKRDHKVFFIIILFCFLEPVVFLTPSLSFGLLLRG